MAIVETYVEVEVELDDFDTDDLIEELESRGKMEQKELNRQLLRSIKEGAKIEGTVGVFHNNIKEFS